MAMQTREAVELLSDRARSVGAKLNVLAGLAVFGSFLAVYFGVTAVCLRSMGGAWPYGSALAGLAVALGVVRPIARALVKRAIGLRRMRWIEDLAGSEGMNAEELAKYFTLDSW